jgi:outer membrane biosynthesis protein TonB
MRTAGLVLLLLLTACGVEDDAARQREVQRQKEWNEPCHDQSVLLATTAGSPNSLECPNKLHKMHVQVQTTKSNEEAAALVFCECQKPGAPPVKEPSR